jgi:hypothetical protein
LNSTNKTLRKYVDKGWESVAFVWTDYPSIWVESFGSDLNDGIFFTVYNSQSSNQSYTFTIEYPSLEIDDPGFLKIQELQSGKSLSFEINNDNIVLSQSIKGLKTQILKLSEEDG